MLVRNGIKSSLRERGRTTLFFFLLALLTLLLILALGVLLYCNAIMEDCDAQYHSIALVEYMGAEFPAADEPDPAARRALEHLSGEQIRKLGGVTGWTEGRILTGYSEDYVRSGGAMPYGDQCVLICGSFSKLIRQGDSAWYARFEEARDVTYYTATVAQAVYAKDLTSGLIIDVIPGETDFQPQQGKTYLLHGRIISRLQNNHPLNGMRVFELTAFEEAGELPYAEYDPQTGIPRAFAEAAELYRKRNAYIRVTPCGDFKNVYEFQQGLLYLEQGDFPDPLKPGGCVITPDLAEQMGLAPGDSFTLERLRSNENDYYDLVPDGTEQTFTVSGVTNFSYDNYGCVWTVGENAQTPLFGYLLGTAALENARGEEAAAALRTLVPDNVRVTLLDQGYAETVKPFREVRNTALNVLLICAAGVLAVLVLFAFLYVGKQSNTVRTMVSLGTPGYKVSVWMLSGAFVIVFFAAAAGAAGGILLQPYLTSWLTEHTGMGQVGTRFFLYSETELGIVKEAAFDPQVPLWPNLAAAGAIVLAALLLCRIFLYAAYRGGVLKRGKSRVRVPRGRTSVFGFGPWRFARLSIRRGGMRTLVVPAVSLVLTVVVIFLGGVYQGWVKELEDVRQNTAISGNAVSLNGRYYSKLAVPIDNVRRLQAVADVEDVSVSYSFRYWLASEIPNFSQSSYSQEHRTDWIDRQPEVVAVNALQGAKEFYYTEPNVTWLEGYDASVLQTPDLPLILMPDSSLDKTYPAVLGNEFLEAHDLALGDSLDVMVRCYLQDNIWEMELRLQAVGVYRQNGGRSQIYVPLSAYVPLDVLSAEQGSYSGTRTPYVLGKITEQSLHDYLGSMANFETCRFRLSSAAKLEQLRDALYEAGFSAVGLTRIVRTALVLNDAGYLKLTESMERNIAMGQSMGAAISALVILLGFLISWLMTNARKREFALMRGFGASKLRVFFSFFHEQFLLCLLGCGLGCGALHWLSAGGRLQLYAAAGYFICYLLGTVVAIRVNGRIRLMELLTVRE